jgi:LCP family protein required for cell wall assembly
MPSPDQFLQAAAENSGQDLAPQPGGPPDTQPPKHKRHIWRWTLGVVAVILIIIFAYIFYILTKVSANPFSWQPLETDANGRVNILLMGYGDPGHAGADLSDTNLVISLDTKANRAAMISLPRDMRVNIPDYGYRKLNQAHSLGGPDLASETVSQTLGIPIQYYVATNFAGFSQMVDAVGGLDITVKEALSDPEYPCDDNQYKSCGLTIAAGEQHMDGATVLKYVRCRKGTCGNDFGRAERQQQVIAALMSKVLQPRYLLNPITMTSLANAITRNIKTNMSVNQMLQFGYQFMQATKVPAINVVFSTAPGGYLKSAPGSSDLIPVDGSYVSMAQLVQTIFTNPSTKVPPLPSAQP